MQASLRLEYGEAPDWQWSRWAVGEPDFLAAAARHRVAPLLATWAEDLGMPATVVSTLQEDRDTDRLRAAARLASLGPVADLLEGIDHLVLKGAPLAVLTTGDPLGRGPGDLDLLVSPTSLAAAMSRLTGAGWTTGPDHSSDLDSWAWRHQLEVGHELTLHPPADAPGDAIDLHWRLGPTHDGLPGFDEVWSRRVEVDLGTLRVETISPDDTFRHVLHDAAKDDWGTLRSLVDIHRMSHVLPLPDDRLSRLSLAVTKACVGLPTPTISLPDPGSALAQAHTRQTVGPFDSRFMGDGVRRYVRFVLRSSRSWRDLRSMASGAALPPESVSDTPHTGTVAGFAGAARRRTKRVAQRLRGER